MAKIRIQNIGPLRDTGWIELTPILVFLGKQGVGKSIILKTICHCRWIEKNIMFFCSPGDTKGIAYPFQNYIEFCRFDKSFFSNNSEITYEGEVINVKMQKKVIKVQRHKEKNIWKKYLCEKLTLIPAERIALSAIPNLFSSYRSQTTDFLFNHIAEWEDARQSYTKGSAYRLVTSPSVSYYYDKDEKTDKLIIEDKQEISAKYGSSGQQSAFPIEVIANYLTNLCGEEIFDNPQAIMSRGIAQLKEILSNGKTAKRLYDNLRAQGNRVKLIQRKNSILDENFLKQFDIYKRIMFFIEEPEVNLFPNAQIDLMLYLINCIHKAYEKTKVNSYLTIATHSPYILDALDLIMAVAEANEKNKHATKHIVNSASLQIPIMTRSDVGAYFIKENGELKQIERKDPDMIEATEFNSEYYDDIMTKLNEVIYG